MGPGRVWSETSDNGYSRASFPIALSENNQNCVHNGEVTFLFSSTKSPNISNVVYQITTETCEYWQFNMWGTLTASYTPQTISNAVTLENNMATEIANRLPVEPFTSLATDYPNSGINLSSFTAGYASGTVTLYGVYINGVNYISTCTTRYGNYAFCNDLRVPSYSTAKSMFVETALSRIGQQFGSGTYNVLLKTWVPQYIDGGTWTSTTFQNMSDMASGNYDSSGFETDEDSTDENDFIAAASYCCGTTTGTGTASSKVYQAFHLFTSTSTTPGTLWVYHTHDSFLLTSAMQAFVQSNIGASSDIFTKTVTDVYSPLKLSQGGLTMMRTSDQTTLCTPASGAVGCPVGGYGMYLIADDIAKLGNFFFNGGGVINGVQVQDPARENDTMMRTSNLGLVTPDSGFYSGTPPVANTYHYHNEFWDKYWTTTEFPNDGFTCQFWVPFLSGYGGISVVLMPNGGVYYIYTESGDFYWDNAVIELNTIIPMCGQGIHSPIPNSSLTSSTATFQWYPYNSATMSATVPTAISTASAYWLDVGPTEGSNQYYSRNVGTALQATVTGLPTDGSTIWARWYYETGGSWALPRLYLQRSRRSPERRRIATMTSPTPNSVLSGSSVAVHVDHGHGSERVLALILAAVAGGNQYYSQNQGTNTSVTVSGLPSQRQHRVRHIVFGNRWILGQQQLHLHGWEQYSRGDAIADAGHDVEREQCGVHVECGSGATAYYLDIGSSVGGNQYYSQNEALDLTATAGGLPTGAGITVYVTLYSLVGGTWQSTRTRIRRTTQRAAAAVMSSPMPGSTFTGSSEMFSWNPVAGAQAYYLDIGTSMGGNQIYSVNQGTNTSVTVSTLPTDGSQVYVTLYTELGGTWYNNQYNYTAVTASLAVITAPSPGSPLTGTSQTFTWNTGTGPTQYSLDVGSTCWRKPILLAEPGDGDVGDGKRVAGGWQHGVRDAVLAGGRDVGIERVHVHGSAASIDHERVGDGRSRNVQLECGNQRDKLLSGSRLDTGRERSVLGESGDEPDGAGVRIAAEWDDLHHAVLVDRRDVLQHANQHSRRLGRNPKEGADFGPRLFFLIFRRSRIHQPASGRECH